MGSPEYRGIMKGVLGDQTGPKNMNWRGGRHVDSRGYITVLVSPDDEIGLAMLRTKKSFQKYGRGHIHEHRVVMAQALGRPLLSREEVHHVNGDKTDNRIENLKLFGSRSEHMRYIHLAACPHCGKSLR